jgi:hypothetical protein
VTSGHGRAWVDYDYALVRVVPHVHLGELVNVGVVLYAHTAGFLAVRLRYDVETLAARFPGLDRDSVGRALKAFERICVGGGQAGAIGLLSPSERFHWLISPRSTVVQTSEVHGGRTRDPAAELEHLLDTCVPEARP